MTPHVREVRGRSWAIGWVQPGRSDHRLEGTVAVVTEVELIQDDPLHRDEVVDRRRYGGVAIRLGSRALFIGKRDAGMPFPRRWALRMLAWRARHAIARRLARSVNAELHFPPRAAGHDQARLDHPAGKSPGAPR